MRIFKNIGKHSARVTHGILLLLTLTSMIGCSRYVVVNGDEMVSVKKGELEQLHSDNELLIQNLTECRGNK